MLNMLSVLLAQTKSTGGEDAAALGALFGVCCCYGLFFILFGIVPMAGMWKAFAKAGQPGWAAIIPIYNIVVLLQAIGQPIMPRLIFHLIPFVNIYFAIVDVLAFIRCFGKDVGFLIGLMFLPFVFWPMLGFGSDQYTPPPGVGRPM